MSQFSQASVRSLGSETVDSVFSKLSDLFQEGERYVKPEEPRVDEYYIKNQQKLNELKERGINESRSELYYIIFAILPSLVKKGDELNKKMDVLDASNKSLTGEQLKLTVEEASLIQQWEHAKEQFYILQRQWETIEESKDKVQEKKQRLYPDINLVSREIDEFMKIIWTIEQDIIAHITVFPDLLNVTFVGPSEKSYTIGQAAEKFKLIALQRAILQIKFTGETKTIYTPDSVGDEELIKEEFIERFNSKLQLTEQPLQKGTGEMSQLTQPDFPGGKKLRKTKSKRNTKRKSKKAHKTKSKRKTK